MNTASQAIPTDEELSALVGKLTLEEKLLMLAVTDGANGARGQDLFDSVTAACFPACVSIAATFNRSLSRKIGEAIGQETLTKGSQVLLGPTVCLHRSPLGGRNFEAFSEDPYLTGTLASHFIQGLQADRIAATLKHFFANEQDTNRFTVNEEISERAMREIYLKPFEIVVKTADPWAIMSSYNKVNGAHVDAQSKFLMDILRKEWGWDGLVMSDWAATSNAVESVKYGLDLEMPGPAHHRTVAAVGKAVDEGKVSHEDINARVLTILRLLRKVGKFGDRRQMEHDERAVDLPEHRTLIRQAGAEGLVLLKNKDNILPLQLKAKPRCKVALLGPLAKYASAHGGGAASLNCHYKITPFEAFTEKVGLDADITYAQGAHIFRTYPELEKGTMGCDGHPGFSAQYFSNRELRGQPFATGELPRGRAIPALKPETREAKSVRVTTTYYPERSGNHYVALSGIGPTRMFIDDVQVAEQKNLTKIVETFFLGGYDEVCFRYQFEAGNAYQIRVESVAPPAGSAEIYLLDETVGLRVGLVEQQDMEADLVGEAVAVAKEADYAIVFVGHTLDWETEGQDRLSMALPADGSQDRLIQAVANVNTRTIVVNSTGAAVDTPWINDVDGFIQAWYAGQETGNAIVDIILGETSPSGKLPISWPKRYEDTGCYGNFGWDSYESKEVKYAEDVFVGYRHFDRHYNTEKEVLFPFGFGLSYTQFTLKNPKVSGTIEAGAKITATVKNVGKAAGAETVQIYIAPPTTEGLSRPSKELAGYDKIWLSPGEEGLVTFAIDKQAGSYWNDSLGQWSVTPGTYGIILAASSAPRDELARLSLTLDEQLNFGP